MTDTSIEVDEAVDPALSDLILINVINITVPCKNFVDQNIILLG